MMIPTDIMSHHWEGGCGRSFHPNMKGVQMKRQREREVSGIALGVPLNNWGIPT
jgi:hypothetical protein